MLALSVGAFELIAGGEASGGIGADLGLVELGGGARQSKSTIRSAGDARSCADATDEAPSVGCRSPIQIFLTPIALGATGGAFAAAERESIDAPGDRHGSVARGLREQFHAVHGGGHGGNGEREALVHYLRQPGATAAVCDRTSKGPRFTGSSAADFAALSGALIDGEVRSELWQRCAMLLLESADAEVAASLLDELAHAYRRLLSVGAIEQDGGSGALARVASGAAVQAARDRAARRRGGSRHWALRQALEQGALGPFASEQGRELLVSIDLEHGLWKGKPLTQANLDELAATENEQMSTHRAAHTGCRDRAGSAAANRAAPPTASP